MWCHTSDEVLMLRETMPSGIYDSPIYFYDRQLKSGVTLHDPQPQHACQFPDEYYLPPTPFHTLSVHNTLLPLPAHRDV